MSQLLYTQVKSFKLIFGVILIFEVFSAVVWCILDDFLLASKATKAQKSLTCESHADLFSIFAALCIPNTNQKAKHLIKSTT